LIERDRNLLADGENHFQDPALIERSSERQSNSLADELNNHPDEVDLEVVLSTRFG